MARKSGIAYDDFDPSVHTFWLCFTPYKTRASLERKGAMVVFSNWPKAKLYRVENGQFELIADKNPDTHDGRCDNCGESIKAVADRFQGSIYRPRGNYQWLRENGKIAEPLQLVRLCVECE